jgi:hypothetical protein
MIFSKQKLFSNLKKMYLNFKKRKKIKILLSLTINIKKILRFNLQKVMQA